MDRVSTGTFGLTQQWNLEHYRRVCEARKAAGIAERDTTRLTGHPLLGKSVRHKQTRCCFVIEHVILTWWQGWYLQAIARPYGEQDTVALIIGTTTSQDPDILVAAAHFEEDYEVMADVSEPVH
ncbi:hypothetical protein QU481_17545 [Crenobacter sp. SG2303]|uniref:DUF4258 domain-containing protein n=1 Tax=Crenobacter oryzisoli TaxID=3056844 RepID=A0ABT7XS90_9NEIS|nr:hypothetical protein [Crenobacter sp. SG2303]MDN0076667.1 hypothetical protein [Crenobacter sp. SG2303]